MAAIAEGLSIIKHAERRDAIAAPSRRRDDALARPRGLPVRHRRGRGGRGVAARVGRRLVAGRPDRRRPRPLARARRVQRAGSRTPARAAGRCTPRSTSRSRRRSSRRRSSQRFESRGDGRLRRQGPLGHALGVRRPRGEALASVDHELRECSTTRTRSARRPPTSWPSVARRRGRGPTGTFTFAVSGGRTPWADVRRAGGRATCRGPHVVDLPGRRARGARRRPRPQPHQPARPCIGAARRASMAMAVNDDDLDAAAGRVRARAARPLRPRAPGARARRPHGVARPRRPRARGGRPARRADRRPTRATDA